jgi:small-conductance mechanosensitive channel
MKKMLTFVLVAVVLFTIHEGVHALIAVIYGEYYAFHWSIFPQVIFRTPTEERIGIQWAVISGTSNLVTLSLGYLLLTLGRRIARSHSMFLKASIYYLTLISLLIDAFNLSIGPFIYGGDAIGIAVGLGISRYLVQAVFFLILLANRELVAQKLLPIYEVKTDHPLFRPWVRLKY